MAGPRIEATVVVNDKATPELEKLAKLAADMGVKMGDGVSNGITAGTDKVMTQLEKMRTALKELATVGGVDALKTEFQSLGTVVREALNVNVAKEFATTLKTQSTAAIDTVKNNAVAAADQIRGVMRTVHDESNGVFSREFKETAKLFANIYAFETGKTWIENAASYESEKVHLKALGIDPKTQQEYINRADEMRNKYTGITASEGLQIQRDLRGVLTHADEVGPMTEPMVQFLRALKSSDPKMTNESVESVIQNLAKSAELMGYGRTPEKLGTFLDYALKNKIYAGGLLDYNQYLAMAKQGGMTIGLADPEFAMAVAPIMATQMGGFRFGTSMQSLQRFAGNGYARKLYQVAALYDAGLLSPDQIEYDKNGHIKGTHGYLKDQALLDRNPFEWATTTFRAGVDKIYEDDRKSGRLINSADIKKAASEQMTFSDAKGHEEQFSLQGLADEHGVGNNEELMRKLVIARKLLDNGPLTRLFSEFMVQEAAIRNHIGNVNQASGVKDAMNLYKQDPIVALHTLGTAIGEFGMVLTSGPMAGAAKSMAELADGIRSITTEMSKIAKDMPGTAKFVGEIVAALTALAGIKAATGVTKLLSGGLLGQSATRLDESAAALKEAAYMLQGKSPSGGSPTDPKSSGWGLSPFKMLSALFLMASAVYDAPPPVKKPGAEGKDRYVIEQPEWVKSFNSTMDPLTPGKGWASSFKIGPVNWKNVLGSLLGNPSFLDDHVQGALPTKGGPLPVTLTNPTAQKVEGKADVNVNVKLDASAIQQTIKAKAQVNLGQGFSTGQSPTPAMGPR